MKQPHDIDLGPRLSAEAERELFQGNRNHPILMCVMHYLRDRQQALVGEAKDWLKSGQRDAANMSLGGQDELDQLFGKLQGLRAAGEVEHDAAA